MPMSTVLQVALFFASLAVVVLVACLIPIAFQARRQLEQLVVTAGLLKADMAVLVHDGQALMQNVNVLVTRANHQMDDVEQVVCTVRQWAERTDRLVDAVGATLEPPVVAMVRNLNLLRTGVTTFFQALMQRNSRNQKQNQPTQEYDHV